MRRPFSQKMSEVLPATKLDKLSDLDSGGEDSTGFPNPWLGSLVLQSVCTRRHYKLKMSLIYHSS